jgi:hypothetical protein
MSTVPPIPHHPRRRLGATSIALAAITSLTLAGCGDNRAASRPMVLTNGTQLADLYMDGELTDTKGYRWDVAIIPGISPTLEGVGDSYTRAGGYIRRFGTHGVFNDGGRNSVGDMYHAAGSDCLGDYTIGGIGRDYRQTSADIADLVNDKPFGWFAHVAWRSTWGYVLKPVGRIISGVPASATVATAATIAGSVEGVGRVAIATGDVAVMGTIYPAGRLAWHQPAYLFSIFNAEPALEHDGRWGLHIIGRPEEAVPTTLTTN